MWLKSTNGNRYNADQLVLLGIVDLGTDQNGNTSFDVTGRISTGEPITLASYVVAEQNASDARQQILQLIDQVAGGGNGEVDFGVTMGS